MSVLRLYEDFDTGVFLRVDPLNVGPGQIGMSRPEVLLPLDPHDVPYETSILSFLSPQPPSETTSLVPDPLHNPLKSFARVPPGSLLLNV